MELQKDTGEPFYNSYISAFLFELFNEWHLVEHLLFQTLEGCS